jgi:hypothetical protein
MTRRAARRALVLISGTVAAAGCAGGRATPDRPYPPQELSALVTGRTMDIGVAGSARPHTLIYLAADGTGWLDRQVGAGPPQPRTMSMLTDWHVDSESKICAWASPPIGAMPNFAPASPLCVQVVRPAGRNAGLAAEVQWNGREQDMPLQVYPFNAFPTATIEQYRLQVRVLFGGRIPEWPRR